jgi:hypothetical protein
MANARPTTASPSAGAVRGIRSPRASTPTSRCRHGYTTALRQRCVSYCRSYPMWALRTVGEGCSASPATGSPSVGIDRSAGIAWAGGYVGEGVAASHLGGRTVADLIAGVDTPRTELPWVGHRSRTWEPEPLRWMAINGALVGMEIGDRSEARRGRSSRLAGTLERLVRR